MTEPTRLSSLTLFFPCHNEEENVEAVTEAAVKVGPRVAERLEVLIVDDGSTDRTGSIGDRLAEQHDVVRCVHNRPNRGYGGALRRGFQEARCDWVFYTDGDQQFDLNELEKLLPVLDRYDIVSAYRQDRQESFLRRFNGRCWTALVNLLFGMRLRDIDCAFKLYPRRLFDEVELWSDGALIDAETLAKATRLGYRVGQIGVRHYPRTAGESSGANLRVIARAFRELFTMWRRIRRVGAGSKTRSPAQER